MADRLRLPTLRVALALLALLAAACLWSASAQAYEGINQFTMTPSGTQAGGHPDVNIQMEWDNSVFHDGTRVPPNNPCACDDARIITQHFPTGFIGNPHATPVCEIVEFSFGRCPPSSQVGTVEPIIGFSPLYNVSPHPDEASLVAFWVPLVQAPVFIRLSGRTDGDYGLDAESSPIYHPLPINTLGIELWGVPSEPVHAPARFEIPLEGYGACFGTKTEGCPGETGATSNIPPVPYLEAPTECDVPLTATADIEYYTHGISHAEDMWPSTTGCEQLTFNPSLTAEPTTERSDSPSGVDVDLRVPQEQSPTTPSPSEIRTATVTLPEGFSINPNAADGKLTCADADTGIGTLHGATCPEFSKVGTLSIDSSALPTPIPGAIYLGDPEPGDRYRLILAADGFGTHIKLAGSAHPDPRTGQLVISFDELPQTPLTDFNMHFFGSERGLLATPTKCGSYPVESEFVPWDGLLPVQHSVSSFSVSNGPQKPGQSASENTCPGAQRPFSPSLAAGSLNTTAGTHSPFTLELTREDGDQNLRGLAVKTPPGFAATLSGIPYCPDSTLAEIAAPGYAGLAESAAPKCPAASLIGSSTVGAGAGTHPVYLPGRVYLAGPHNGAPLSLAVVTPAVSGPYDLGNVVVRASIDVDPVSAQVTAVSDPIPTILEGIPLRLRSVKVNLDRQGFALNPTNCDPFAVESTITGDEGATAARSTGFQVADCAKLPYAPKLSLKLSGGVNRRGHPAIRSLFKATPGEANTRSISVALPPKEQLDNAHVGNVCTRVQFSQEACPASSDIGSAEANTPLLDSPLKGSVYLRTNPAHSLPDLVADLKGQFDIELAGTIDTTKSGALRATFESVPDAPVSSFALNLAGGAKGLVQNSESLCGGTKQAALRMVGQNGAVRSGKTTLQVACGGARHKRHQARHSGSGRAAR